MKYRLPKDCSAIVVEGERLDVAADGSVHAPEAAAPALLAHGALPWRDGAAPPAVASRPALGEVETMSRSALTDALARLGHKPVPASTEELRRTLRRALAARPT